MKTVHPAGTSGQSDICEAFTSGIGVSQTHIIGNIGITSNFVFSEIFSFLLYLHYMMLANAKLDVTRSNRIRLNITNLIVFVHF